jgi:peptidoglycan/LPS O-acetylase OafA/YrhL
MTQGKYSVNGTTKAPETGRLYQLQTLRFVAAGLVMFGHGMQEGRQHGSQAFSDALYGRPWGSGVEIFFVISGFIIYFITRGAGGGSRVAIDFFVRRIIRLAPLYWLFTLLMAAVILLLPGDVAHTRLTVSMLIRSMLFIPYETPGVAGLHPVLGQGWTLNYEFLFYAVFGVCLWLTRHRLAAVSAVLCAIVLAGVLVPLPPTVAFYATYRLLLFVGGMALARWYDDLPRLGTPTVAVLLVLAAFVGGFIVPLPAEWEPFTRSAMSLIGVYAILFWRAPPVFVSRGALPLLGDASYALYLGHPFAINAVLIVWKRLGIGYGYAFLAVACLAAIGSTLLVHLWLERPLMRVLTNAYKSSRLGRWAAVRPPREEKLSLLNEAPPGSA